MSRTTPYLPRGGRWSTDKAIEAALCSGDPDDYFYVDLATATTLVLDLTNLPAGTDYDLVLYNAAADSTRGLAQLRQRGGTDHAGRFRRTVLRARLSERDRAQQPGVPADRILGRGRGGRGTCSGGGVGKDAGSGALDR